MAVGERGFRGFRGSPRVPRVPGVPGVPGRAGGSGACRAVPGRAGQPLSDPVSKNQFNHGKEKTHFVFYEAKEQRNDMTPHVRRVLIMERKEKRQTTRAFLRLEMVKGRKTLERTFTDQCWKAPVSIPHPLTQNDSREKTKPWTEFLSNLVSRFVRLGFRRRLSFSPSPLPPPLVSPSCYLPSNGSCVCMCQCKCQMQILFGGWESVIDNPGNRVPRPCCAWRVVRAKVCA